MVNKLPRLRRPRNFHVRVIQYEADHALDDHSLVLLIVFVIKDELRRETLQYSRENLEKEPQIMELRNQCRIIRTSELATAQEKLNELEKRKRSSSSTLLVLFFINHKAMNQVDEECEALQEKFLEKEIDTSPFVHKYKNLRTTYHKRALNHLSAKTSTMC
ncbi:unnamed protein product [Brassica rapa]|uniref:VPS37 C-terminal domain-containing protein n=2 Tax=Brassica TaxID=3705 RepID=A0A3P6BNP6_BRACM|nr:unnamed protein product [Brassica napus]CAG7902686.1 unnamed protein product [Brassica rapa]VDC99040.1 unnamed protein product [Brassica rapa]